MALGARFRGICEDEEVKALETCYVDMMGRVGQGRTSQDCRFEEKIAR